MRVAVVVEEIPAESGGAVTFSQTIIEALRELEAESHHSFDYYSAGGAASPGVTALPPPAGALPSAAKRLAGRARDIGRDLRGQAPQPSPLQQALAATRADVVWFAARHAEPCQLPFIFTVLDIEHLRQPWFPEVSSNWDGRDSFFSHFIPRATRVIVPNEAGRDQVLRGFAINSDRVMALPHPTPRFALEAGRREALGKEILERRGIGEPYLLYPAQFWPHKNHLTALEALAELHGAGQSMELVLVGADTRDRPGQLEHVRRLAQELGVAESVHFLGFVATEELVALYQHAFALVYMSLFGPENLPPLEAMALGCPAVVANVLGSSEQFGEAALLVEPTDPRSVAEAVRSLEDPNSRERLIEAGRDRATSWSAADYVAAVVEFLDRFEHTRRMWS
jgi:glycosyltransferase involved in cell wall biosynthesis